MTQKHPTAPPQWQMDGWQARIETMGAHVPSILLEVIQWGADQGLEACRQWLEINGAPSKFIDGLLDALRPELSNLKEQALEDLDALQADLANYGMGFKTTNIRRALESIPDPS